MEAHLTDQVEEFLAAAGDFLNTRPVEHNLVLTIAEFSRSVSAPCRWTWVTDSGQVIGALLQSPATFTATVTPMPDEAVRCLVERLSHETPDIPGMNGHAHTVATFAGAWASALGVPVHPIAGQRLYKLGRLQPPNGIAGGLDPASNDDRAMIVAWDDAFSAETGLSRPRGDDRAAAIAHRVERGLFWLWRVDGRPVSMAFASPPLAGASRIGAVYTPPAERGTGYASACVGAISAHLLTANVEMCLLYTQLSNPTSNRIYQQLGYEPIAEILAYRFGGIPAD